MAVGADARGHSALEVVAAAGEEESHLPQLLVPRELDKVIDSWQRLDRLGRRKFFADAVNKESDRSSLPSERDFAASSSVPPSSRSTQEDDLAATQRGSVRSEGSARSGATGPHGAAGPCSDGGKHGRCMDSRIVAEEGKDGEKDCPAATHRGTFRSEGSTLSAPSGGAGSCSEEEEEEQQLEEPAEIMHRIRREREDREKVRLYLLRHGFRGVCGRRKQLLGARFVYPLHRAVQASDAAMVQLLLQAGANPMQADARGRTPHEYALQRNRAGSQAQTLALLKEAEASLGGRRAPEYV